jgi:hypothetical protein
VDWLDGAEKTSSQQWVNHFTRSCVTIHELEEDRQAGLFTRGCDPSSHTLSVSWNVWASLSI